MQEFDLPEIKIEDPFWNRRLQMNAEQAIFFQWQMLEATRTIDNFRIASKQKEGFRYGFFYADSDATKWLDAASRILITAPNPKLKDLVDKIIETLSKARDSDGYLFTYNQLCFPKIRWKNIQIEHELYCHGHLIEGSPYHLTATGDNSLLNIAKKAADVIDNEFRSEPSKKRNIAPGHQELEIALIKLYRCTKDTRYLELANHFLMQRGQLSFFGVRFLKQMISTALRMRKVEQMKKQYLKTHPEQPQMKLPEHVKMDMPKDILLRSIYLFLSGKYNQQHKSVLEQTVPEGHAVRFAYQQTALAMLCRERPNPKFLSVLQKSWDHMIQKRMFVSGGIGSIPIIEGFGYDYELDPAYAYCETCAAIGSLLWNWEMTLLTHEAKFADLFEWQLYNAASVGISNRGDSYLYRNPLSSTGTLKREKWFATPCCPSNISRLWASLGQFVYSFSEDSVYIHQYIGSKIVNPKKNTPISLEIKSELPYSGHIQIKILEVKKPTAKLQIRIPSWTELFTVNINGREYASEKKSRDDLEKIITASGINPYHSYYLPVFPEHKEGWNVDDLIEIDFSMPIRVLSPHKKVKAVKNQIAIARGPLLYCAEHTDNLEINFSKEKINPQTIRTFWDTSFGESIILLQSETISGKIVNLIPYYLWGNRDSGWMSVYLGAQRI